MEYSSLLTGIVDKLGGDILAGTQHSREAKGWCGFQDELILEGTPLIAVQS